MTKMIKYKWQMKKNIIISALVILVLSNLSLLFLDKGIYTQILSIFLLNIIWYFLSCLILIIFKTYELCKILNNNTMNPTTNNEISSYKFIGLKILSGLVELFIITLLAFAAIGINLQEISPSFLEQGISILKLLGFNLNRGIPIIIIGLFFFYCVLLEAIYLTLVSTKTIFKHNKNRIFLYNTVFISIISINGIIGITIFNNSFYNNTLTIIMILIKSILVIFLMFMLNGYLLAEFFSSQ